MVGFSTSRKGLSFLEFLHQQQLYMMPRLDLMTANDPKMDRCNYGHNVTFNFDYVLTWFSGLILPYVCNCKMGFVSNHLKASKLQMVVQAPTSATASSIYYLGPLDQRPSV